MKSLLAYLNRLHPVGHELEGWLPQVLRYKKVPKNNLLLQQGEVSHKAWYLEKGLVRFFYYNNGHEVTTCIVPEDNAVLEAKSLFEQQPSEYYIEALENSLVWAIDYTAVQYAFEHYPESKEIRTRITDWYSHLKDLRIKATGMLTAKERYKYFEKHFPHLPGRVKLGHIASYLDMDVRTLTKVRKNIHGQ